MRPSLTGHSMCDMVKIVIHNFYLSKPFGLDIAALIEYCFLICMNRETLKFKQSVLTFVSLVSSVGIRLAIISQYIHNPTMILYKQGRLV